MDIKGLIAESHETAKTKGWWSQPRGFLDQIALMHSELSEALEEYRIHGMDETKFIYDDPDKPDKKLGIAIEFADVLIRIGDTCGKYSIPLEEALREKLKYNKSREYRHGGKLA